MKLSYNKGFTLIEIMIIVAVIAIVLAIAIPNYFHMSAISKRTVCINNLRKITEAVEQWALESGIPSGASISQQQEEVIYSDYIRGNSPKCPSGGVYTLNPVGENPQVSCSKEAEGHRL